MIPYTSPLPQALAWEIQKRELRRNYGAFCAHANPGFIMTKMHKYVCDKVQEFLEAKTGKAMDILLLTIPPRHGKSYTVTETLPAWFLGNNPKGEVILCSYQSTVAETFSQPVRSKFKEYCGDIFGIGLDKAMQRIDLWHTDTGGILRAAGLDAGITRYGANLFIIDDPIKNRSESMSETIVKKILAEMEPSVQSRIYPGGKLIIIQTRWVENDCAGYVKDNWADWIWADINLPAEWDEESEKLQGPCPLGRKIGDSLMGPHLGDPVLDPKIMNDNLWLRDKKKLVTATGDWTNWNSLYQGRPTAATGNLFEEDWFKEFSRDEFMTYKEEQTLTDQQKKGRKRFEYMQMSVDASFKDGEKNDPVAIGLRCIYQGNVYLYKQTNRRMGFVHTLEKIKQYFADFPEIDELVIEDKANGSAIIDALKYAINVPPVVAVNPMGGKVSRAEATTHFYKAFGIYIAKEIDDDAEVDWHTATPMTPRQRIKDQYKKFPYAKHDDMVDEGSQGMVRLIKLCTGVEPTPERKILRFTKWYPDMWEDFEQMDAKAQDKFIQTYGAPEEWRTL